MLTLNYKDPRSLHQQITDGMRELIISGAMTSDEKLPSVRELSVALTVNPNTVQRAYRELEAEGFIYSILGKGSFVAKRDSSYDAERIKLLYETLDTTVRELEYLGNSKENLIKRIEEIYCKGERKND